MTPYQQYVSLVKSGVDLSSGTLEFDTWEEYEAWRIKKFGT